MQPRTIAIINCLLPILAVHLSYLISASQELVPVCNPYVDGCVSISRAARKGDAIFLFRAAVMLDAVFLMCYWWMVGQWLEKLYGSRLRSVTVMYGFGFIGAVFLVLYVDYLGTDGEFYAFMRRFGIIIYFTFTAVAQLLQLNLLYKYQKHEAFNKHVRNVVIYQFMLCTAMLALGFVNLGFDVLGINTDESENLIEWNFALLMSLYYLGTARAWQLSGFSWNFYLNKTQNN